MIAGTANKRKKIHLQPHISKKPNHAPINQRIYRDFKTTKMTEKIIKIIFKIAWGLALVYALFALWTANHSETKTFVSDYDKPVPAGMVGRPVCSYLGGDLASASFVYFPIDSPDTSKENCDEVRKKVDDYRAKQNVKFQRYCDSIKGKAISYEQFNQCGF